MPTRSALNVIWFAPRSDHSHQNAEPLAAEILIQNSGLGNLSNQLEDLSNLYGQLLGVEPHASQNACIIFFSNELRLV